LPSDIYYISTLPVRVEMMDLILVILAAIVISFLATIYPSWHASRVNPVEALRYE
jgi:lipoprotein-releasing system permease protein